VVAGTNLANTNPVSPLPMRQVQAPIDPLVLTGQTSGGSGGPIFSRPGPVRTGRGSLTGQWLLHRAAARAGGASKGGKGVAIKADARRIRIGDCICCAICWCCICQLYRGEGVEAPVILRKFGYLQTNYSLLTLASHRTRNALLHVSMVTIEKSNSSYIMCSSNKTTMRRITFLAAVQSRDAARLASSAPCCPPPSAPVSLAEEGGDFSNARARCC
jgi:hypothetical protein